MRTQDRSSCRHSRRCRPARLTADPVGDLVLARKQIIQFGTLQDDSAFLGMALRLHLLTTELQANVRRTRMLPIGNIHNNFPRVVREPAVACGKQVRIDLEGQET